jgi:hypothetical protein
MTFEDYVRYLEERQAALNFDHPKDTVFQFEGIDGTTQTIDVVIDILCLIDYEMVRYGPELDDNFVRAFKMPGILPGGKHCLLNRVSGNDSDESAMPNQHTKPPGSAPPTNI